VAEFLREKGERPCNGVDLMPINSGRFGYAIVTEELVGASFQKIVDLPRILWVTRCFHLPNPAAIASIDRFAI
jgi:hypothetical protein